MISTLGGYRSPQASEMEMHDLADLLEIAAFVGELRNSTGWSRPCSSAELVCMKINGATLLAAYLHAISNQLAVTSSPCSQGRLH